ncbi:mannosyltransferase [Marinicella pacifica]|uniref:Mannosyltransferase n=1 Tax=Marinicella pacifica TaxID=1171543 RepID=A0A917CDN6_9GAMM|nr:glycosyltransferase [Marinicella pacifica]GGF84955.1 mannosyltransferase [Marinicella pacifica]
MNILHIGKFYPPYHGGMETYLRDLAEAQVKQGHQVAVLVHNHHWHGIKSNTVTEQPMPGLTLIRQACLRPVLFTPLMLGLNRQVKRLIRQQSVDVIHLHVPNPGLFMLLINRSAKKVPWVLRWHSDMVTERASRWLRFIYGCIKPFETALLKNSRKILISTPEYIKKSHRLQQFRPHVMVVPLGLNTQHILLPKPLTLNKKPMQILTLGRLSFYKNHRMLIHAMQQLPDMHLTIAGGGDLHQDLQRLIHKLKLTDQIHLTGPVSETEKERLLGGCHVLCLASNDRAESYGMVLLEAMARHKIILAADTPGSGMRWLAEHYERGFTFNYQEVNDLVEKLQLIRHNYQNIMQQPVKFALSIEQTAAALSPIYKEICTEKSP